MAAAAVPGPEALKLVGLKLKALGAAGSLGASPDLVMPTKAFGTFKTPTLRAQLFAGIREAAKPAIAKTRAEVLATGPKRGKLNVSVSKSQIKTTTRLTGPRFGVRITNRSRGGRGLNKGEIRHPVWPGKKPREDWDWSTEEYKGSVGWFDRTLADQQPAVAAVIYKVCELVTIEATRRL